MPTNHEIVTYIKTTHCYVSDICEHFRELPEDQILTILKELQNEGRITIRNAVVETV